MGKYGFGNRPLYHLLMLSAAVGRCSSWKLAPLALLAAGGIGWLWATASAMLLLGAVVSAILLAMAAADYVLFAALPRLGLSFGPVSPQWLGMMAIRTLLALAAVPFLAGHPWPSLVATAAVQALVWLAVLYGTVVEPFRIEVTHLSILAPKLANPGSTVRIVQVADLHVERLTRRERALPALVAEAMPDLILLTGDLLNTTYNADRRALADLGALLARFHAPGGVYAVWGTPEVDLPEVLRPLLADLGIVLLEDQAVPVMVQGHLLWLMGITCTRDLEAAGAKLRSLVAAAPPDALTLLLFHTPDLMPQASGLGVDLVFSGHTHGGQWRLPGFGAIVTSSRFGKRYESGHVREGSTHLYVSRGLGMEGYGMPRARFFSRPELAVIELDGRGERR